MSYRNGNKQRKFFLSRADMPQAGHSSSFSFFIHSQRMLKRVLAILLGQDVKNYVTQCLAGVISISILVGSVAPSYAEATQNIERQQSYINRSAQTTPANPNITTNRIGYRHIETADAQALYSDALSQCPKGFEACSTYYEMPQLNASLDAEARKAFQAVQEYKEKRPHDLLKLGVKIEQAIATLSSNEAEPVEKSDAQYFEELYKSQAEQQYKLQLRKIQGEQGRAQKQYKEALKRCAQSAEEASCVQSVEEQYKIWKEQLNASKADLKQQYDTLVSKEAIANSYQANQLQFSAVLKEAKAQIQEKELEEGRAYLQGLARELLTYKDIDLDTQTYPDVEPLAETMFSNGKGQAVYHTGDHRKEWTKVLFYNLLEESFAAFALVGGITESQRKEGRKLLRQEINEINHCADQGEEGAYYCTRAIKAASALAVIGNEDSSADRATFKQLMKAGLNAYHQSAQLILLGGISLLEFNGEKDFKDLVRQAANGEHHWTEVFDVISVEAWMDRIHTAINGRKWYPENTQWAGAYRGKSSSRYEQEVTKSAWTDLGRYLAVKAFQDDKSAKKTLDELMQQDLITPQVKMDTRFMGNPGAGPEIAEMKEKVTVHIKFPAFIQGAYEGFYELPDWNKMSYHAAEWKKVQKALVQDTGTYGSWTDVNTFILANLINMGKPDLDGESYRDVQYSLTSIYSGKPSRLLLEWRDLGYDQAKKKWERTSKYKERPTYLIHSYDGKNGIYDDQTVARHQQAYEYINAWRKVGRGMDIGLALVGVATIVVGAAKGTVGLVRTIRIARAARTGKGLGQLAKTMSRVRKLAKNLNMASLNAQAMKATQAAQKEAFLQAWNQAATGKGIQFQTGKLEVSLPKITRQAPLETGAMFAQAQSMAQQAGTSMRYAKGLTQGTFGIPQVTAQQLREAKQLLQEATLAEQQATSATATGLRLERELAAARLEQLQIAEKFYQQLTQAGQATAELEKQAKLLASYYYAEQEASLQTVKAAHLNAGKNFETAQRLLHDLNQLQNSYLGQQSEILKLQKQLYALQPTANANPAPLNRVGLDVSRPNPVPLKRPSLWENFKLGWQTKTMEWPTLHEWKYAFNRKVATVGLFVTLNTGGNFAEVLNATRTVAKAGQAIELVETTTRAAESVRIAGNLAKEGASLSKSMTVAPQAASVAAEGWTSAKTAAPAHLGIHAVTGIPGAPMLQMGWGGMNLAHLGNMWMLPSLMAIDSQTETALRKSGAMGAGKTTGVTEQALANYWKQLNDYLYATPNQQMAFNQYQQRKLKYLTGNAAIQMAYEKAGYPITAKIQSGWQTLQDYFYLTYVAPWSLRYNQFYVQSILGAEDLPAAASSQQNSSMQTVAQLPTPELVTFQTAPMAPSDPSGKSTAGDTPIEVEKLFATKVFQQQLKDAVYGALQGPQTKTQWKKIQLHVLTNKYVHTFNQLRKQAYEHAMRKFFVGKQEVMEAVLSGSELASSYVGCLIHLLTDSNLPTPVKQTMQEQILSEWEAWTNTSRDLEVFLEENLMTVPVFKGKQQIGTWVVAKPKGLSLDENQKVYIEIDNNQMASMYVETIRDGSYSGISVRTDIPVQRVARKYETTGFGVKKITEGLLLINNRIWPMFGVYLLAGMGNVSSTIATFAKSSFTLNNVDMYLMNGMCSVAMGLMSFVAGILQNRFARNADGTVNGARGRLINMNIGFALCLAAFGLPMLGGMVSELGDPTVLKKNLLMTSFVLLGLGAAFIDVSMKPTLLAVTKKADYQSWQGYLSVFKQTVGNMSNYIVPPIAMGLAAAFGSMCDWTIYFPLYAGTTLAIALAYNLFRMHEQTLENKEVVGKKELLSIKNIAKEFLGKQKYNQLIRHGVTATAAHGANMSILGLYVNNLFKAHYPEMTNMYRVAAENTSFFSVMESVWNALSSSWLGHSLLAFTIPIIAGRFLGTYLMKHDIKLFGHTFSRISQGTMLKMSAVAVALAILGIGLGSWPVQVASMVLAALGLTNVSPIVNGYTADQTRHVSDAVSAWLSATSIASFALSLLFGWFLDIASQPMIPFMLPLVLLSGLYYFGHEIQTHRLEETNTTEETTEPEETAPQAGPDMRNPLPN